MNVADLPLPSICRSLQSLLQLPSIKCEFEASLWKLCSQQQCPWVAVNLHLMKLTNICMTFHHIQTTLHMNSFNSHNNPKN